MMMWPDNVAGVAAASLKLEQKGRGHQPIWRVSGQNELRPVQSKNTTGVAGKERLHSGLGSDMHAEFWRRMEGWFKPMERPAAPLR